jgi:hypothetical protein
VRMCFICASSLAFFLSTFYFYFIFQLKNKMAAWDRFLPAAQRGDKGGGRRGSGGGKERVSGRTCCIGERLSRLSWTACDRLGVRGVAAPL